MLPCLQVKKALTMTEKILAKHSNNTSVVPGQNIWTSVDKLMTHDVCGPGTFGIFQREFGENAQVCISTPLTGICKFFTIFGKAVLNLSLLSARSGTPQRSSLFQTTTSSPATHERTGMWTSSGAQLISILRVT